MRDPVPLDPTDDTATPLLRLRVRRRAATTLVEVRGELDLTTRAAFAHALTGAVTASPGRRVVVDLTRCTFFAACGAEVVRRARHTARRRRGSVDVVVGAGGPAAPTIARTLRLAAGLCPRTSVRAAETARRGRTPRPHPHRAPRSRRPTVPRTDRFDQVIAALGRLAEGSFARCDVCGDEIDDSRLRAAADADRCVLHPVEHPAQPH